MEKTSKTKAGVKVKKLKFEWVIFLYALWVILALWISNVFAFSAKAADLQLDQTQLVGACALEHIDLYPLSQGSSLLLISFDQSVIASSVNGMTRQKCLISIPFLGQAGKKIVLERSSIFASRFGETVGSLNHETFFAGSTGLKGQVQLQNSLDDLIYDRQTGHLETACGASGNLRENISVMLQASANASQVELVFLR